MSRGERRPVVYNTMEYRVEYSSPDFTEARVDFFTTLAAAMAFVEAFPGDYEAAIIRTDASGKETYITSEEVAMSERK